MPRKVFKVDIEAAVADRAREALRNRKIGYAAGTEALLAWFADQDESLQAVILGQIPRPTAGNWPA